MLSRIVGVAPLKPHTSLPHRPSRKRSYRLSCALHKPRLLPAARADVRSGSLRLWLMVDGYPTASTTL
jgi:hypothetical protein